MLTLDICSSLIFSSTTMYCRAYFNGASKSLNPLKANVMKIFSWKCISLLGTNHLDQVLQSHLKTNFVIGIQKRWAQFNRLQIKLHYLFLSNWLSCFTLSIANSIFPSMIASLIATLASITFKSSGTFNFISSHKFSAAWTWDSC